MNYGRHFNLFYLGQFIDFKKYFGALFQGFFRVTGNKFILLGLKSLFC